MIQKTPKIYRSKLGALTEKHIIFHSRGAENKMNNALRHGSITQQRMFKQRRKI